jgi:hypothetical protein
VRGANPALERRFDEAYEAGTATFLHCRQGGRPL